MIHVFLPAYNEEVALERVVRKFASTLRSLGEPYRFLVLDDGSTDRTGEVARRLAGAEPLELMTHSPNLGLGATMRDGLVRASEISSDGDLVVTLDCDDTHDPRYLAPALERAREGYDLVILSRYQAGGGEEGLSPVKSFLSRGAGLFLKLFFPIRGVKEYSCGYRVFRASALKRVIGAFGGRFVELPHMGFVVTPEILVKFRMAGCRITEVPFRLHYDQKPGASKNRPLRTIAGYFALVARCWGRKAPGR